MKVFFTFVSRFSTKLSRFYAKKLSVKCYDSIETLPIFNWWQFHETRDLAWLFYTKRPLKRFERSALELLWTEIFNQYIQRFGFGDAYQEMMQIQRRIVSLRVELICNDDPSRLTFIDIEELKLKELRDQLSGKRNYYDTNAQFQEILGHPIDIRTTSVAQYKAYEAYVEEKILRARTA